jgi:hypothetical protein
MEPSGEACAGEFSPTEVVPPAAHRRRPRTDFSDVREKYDRHSRIYMRRCAALTSPLTWIAPAELSDGKTIRDCPLLSDFPVDIACGY